MKIETLTGHDLEEALERIEFELFLEENPRLDEGDFADHLDTLEGNVFDDDMEPADIILFTAKRK